MTKFEKKVLQIVLHQPDRMMPLLKATGQYKNCLKVLEKYFSLSIGIEIEVFDTDEDFRFYRDIYDRLLNRFSRIRTRVIKQAKTDIYRKRTNIVREPGWANINRQFCGEYTIRLFNMSNRIKGLVTLNELLMYFKQNTVFNKEGGIHIHCDSTDQFVNHDFFYSNELIKQTFPSEWLDVMWDTVFDYQGSYNKREVSSYKTAIRFHREYKTIEYRMGKMTYDFETIAKWILCCTYMTKCCHHLKRKSENIFNINRINEFLTL